MTRTRKDGAAEAIVFDSGRQITLVTGVARPAKATQAMDDLWD